MYNTILGAKPLQADGRTFYYSDYNFKGQKVYSEHRWPCCSGTLPQVATDYRINTYLRDSQDIYVNLYIPSTVRWAQDGAQVSLTQKSGYPFESTVVFEVETSIPRRFGLNFRIPQWATGAAIAVNGKRVQEPAIPGKFATVRRPWKAGDHVEVELPLTKRLEPIHPRHAKTVALLSGPLVLFAITEKAPRMTSQQLLAAPKTGPQDWRVETDRAPLNMRPFTAIADEQYSTYLKIR